MPRTVEIKHVIKDDSKLTSYINTNDEDVGKDLKPNTQIINYTIVNTMLAAVLWNVNYVIIHNINYIIKHIVSTVMNNYRLNGRELEIYARQS